MTDIDSLCGLGNVVFILRWELFLKTAVREREEIRKRERKEKKEGKKTQTNKKKNTV